MRVVSVCVATACVIAAISSEPVAAADLGGDCCADLEERVAELEATTARKGNRKVSLRIYGEVNQAVLWWDDSTEQNAYVVTNATTKNILGFEGSAQINPQVSAGYRIELELLNSSSDFVDQGGAGFIALVPPPPFPILGDDGFGGIFTRHSNWWIEHKSLGRLTVGQGSNATDGIAEIDLSGSTSVSGSAVETWNENFILRNESTGQQVIPAGGTLYGVMIDLFRGNFDGGRGNLVRYDSPVVGGFIVSTAWGEDDDWDAAVRYSGEFGGFQVAAGIGYHDGKITDTDNFARLFGNPDAPNPNAIRDHQEWTGSASVIHVPSGVFLTVAGGAREWPDSQLIGENYVYGKAGVFQQWNSLGKTSVYGEYYHVWDVGVVPGTVVTNLVDTDVCGSNCNEEASAWGVGVVQHIDAAAMELYVAYRHYWADDINDLITFTDNHDIEFDAVMSGARIQF